MNRLIFLAIPLLIIFLAISCSDDSTGSERDLTNNQIEIVATHPVAGAEVSVLDSVMITFSTDLDCSTVNESTISVGPGSTGTIICSGNVVVFRPNYAFDFAIIVEVVVSKDIKDVDGNSLGEDLEYSFSTEVEPGK